MHGNEIEYREYNIKDYDRNLMLDYFIAEESKYPVIVTTSKLMTTGVDCKTCKLIVLNNNINSMTEFKQIIGRGTRLKPEYFVGDGRHTIEAIHELQNQIYAEVA